MDAVTTASPAILLNKEISDVSSLDFSLSITEDAGFCP